MSTAFLICANIAGVLGFGLATFLGIIKFNHAHEFNASGTRFKSQMNFFPWTVSEMVANPSSPEGKCWLAFNAICAVCMLVSAYPWELVNVYIGHLAFPPLNVPWYRENWPRCSVLYLRQFLPPFGMLVVCFVTVTVGERNFYERLSSSIHTLGAVTMIGSYIAFEIHHLFWQREPNYWSSLVIHGHALTEREVTKRSWERRLRVGLITACAIFAVGFQTTGVVYSGVLGSCATTNGSACDCGPNASFFTTCADVWRVPTPDDFHVATEYHHEGARIRLLMAKAKHEAVLMNTAQGWLLVLKQFNFWFEVFAGMAMLASHFVIAFACPHFDFNLAEVAPCYHRAFEGREINQL
eukprot:NODE_7746_length_1553_cov_7.778401.p1 GENE.NODE_7746_length_1553_cov_7.778401~~NODE_7746_length_1553_cov_7.778401.p1  ORF type:complete len:410 (+),score=82.15 NODE_7746_length_1553_cov_7.778401:174-1232(+)